MRVVVGIGGSEADGPALRHGVKEARAHGVPLLLVHAWEIAPFDYGPLGPSVPPDPGPYERASRRVLDEALASARAAAPGMEVDGMLVEGAPVDALLEVAADDDLLVVGSVRKGGLAERLPGSFARRCVDRATCPVLVVPAPSR